VGGLIAIEFMLVKSMHIAVFLLTLQYAVRAHAERIATAAAEEGLAAAAAYRASAADGHRTAIDYLAALGPRLHHPRVQVTRTPEQATVRVSGEVDQLVPFLPVRVSVEVAGPVERWVESP
jgi:hypothetical protein